MNSKSKGQLQEALLSPDGDSPDDNQSNSVTVSQIFKIQKDELRSMFVPGQDLETALKKLNTRQIKPGDGRTIRGVPAVMRQLATHPDAGIIGDGGDLQRRANKFGRNKKPLPVVTNYWSSVFQELKNIIWATIAVTSAIAGFCSVWVNGWDAIRESISIVVLAAIIVVISAGADWYKDSNFVKIQSFAKDEKISIICGKLHQTQSVSVWNLVVGDIVLLEAGTRIPADCLVITSTDLRVDESPDDEELITKQKSSMTEQNGQQLPDPFLYADSLVIHGSCKALVCCIGKNSSRGEYMGNIKDELEVDTPLQRKLKNLGNQFSKYALISSFIILAILVTVTCVIETTAGGKAQNVDTEDGERSAGGIIFSKVPKHVNLAVVLLIVSIPEALPLTVGVSLALSVMKMYADGILIKKMDAPERLASCQEICTGKTATLTENNMRVKEFYLEGCLIKNSRKDTFLNCDLNPETITLVQDSIIYNSSSQVELGEKEFVATGNGTEVGLLKFLQDAKIQIQDLQENKLGNIRAIMPFDSDNKYSAVAVNHKDENGNVMKIALYIKGAPEIILGMCPHALGQNGIMQTQQVISEEQGVQVTYRDDYINKINTLAATPYRVIAFAYAELVENDWVQMEQQFQTPSHCLNELVTSQRIQFNLIGAFALKDNVRHGVRQAVSFTREQAQMNVRLISGDHVETATAVAESVGIITQEERGGRFTVMHADDFERQIGGFDGHEEIQDINSFSSIMDELKVLARAKPQHKHMIVKGLQQLGKSVLVTGDGINDVKSIQCANVGFAMGSGCSAAKEVADVILVKDDFYATIQAVKWGRNIYHNVGRFLQFQVTVNLSVIFTIAIGAPILAESPFTSGQLLWINLIMDTFAAFALATEPPLDSILVGPPSKDEDVLTPAIWRQVLGVSFWNVIVMTLMIILPPAFGYFEYGYSTSVLDSCNPDAKVCASKSKTKHLTILYNTFIFLQVFNEINCRKIGRRDFNVFEGIHRNLYFIAVVGGTFAGQFVVVNQFSGILFPTTQLDRGEWGACVAVGATPLAIAAALKLTPQSWLEKVSTMSKKAVDENDTTAPSALLQAYEANKNIKVDQIQKDGFKPVQRKRTMQDDDNFNPV